jgi:hypothetical protein
VSPPLPKQASFLRAVLSALTDCSGAAGFEAMKAYEDHCARNGKPPSVRSLRSDSFRPSLFVFVIDQG